MVVVYSYKFYQYAEETAEVEVVAENNDDEEYKKSDKIWILYKK